MRQRFPSLVSGFNPQTHMLFHHPGTLIGVANMTQIRLDLLRSNLDFPGRLKLQMVLFGAVLGKSGCLLMCPGQKQRINGLKVTSVTFP